MKKTVKPKGKRELLEIIEQEISLRGNRCDLNHINTSLNMSSLFYNTDFNEDISNWNVENVLSMSHIFYCSKFNKATENWNPVILKDDLLSSIYVLNKSDLGKSKFLKI